jgi:hypothetical protein
LLVRAAPGVSVATAVDFPLLAGRSTTSTTTAATAARSRPNSHSRNDSRSRTRRGPPGGGPAGTGYMTVAAGPPALVPWPESPLAGPPP